MASLDEVGLIERNTSEVVTSEELRELLGGGRTPTTYCGYEVSGPVHLGTLVAVSKQIDFLDAGFRVKVLFADLHTYLNQKGGEEFIEEMVESWREIFVRFGLGKAEFVRGTDFQYDRGYIHDVLSVGLQTSVQRARRSMRDIARDLENAKVSQMMYPLMQVVDIKALGVDVAHGGMEQRRIHMLSRELLPGIGYKKPVCVHTPLLCSLQGPASKMSSSVPESLISALDSPEEVSQKIEGAFCPPEAAGNPVMEICRYLLFPRYKSLEVRRPVKYGGDIVFSSYEGLKEVYLSGRLHPADLKKTVAEKLVEMLEPLR